MSAAPELADDVPLSDAYPLGADASVYIRVRRDEAAYPEADLARLHRARVVRRLRRLVLRMFGGNS